VYSGEYKPPQITLQTKVSCYDRKPISPIFFLLPLPLSLFLSAFKADAYSYGKVLQKMINSGKADGLKPLRAWCTQEKETDRPTFIDIVSHLFMIK